MKVKQISPTLFQVGEKYSVKFQKKKGRTLLICNCTNDTKFCNESPLCYHKQLVLEILIKKPIKELVKKLKEEYEGFYSIKQDVHPRVVLDDLEKMWSLVK